MFPVNTNQWKRELWSKESKLNVLGPDGRCSCWKKGGELITDYHAQPSVKYGERFMMVFGSVTCCGVGFFGLIDGNIGSEMSQIILSQRLATTSDFYSYFKWDIPYQHNNDLKYASKSTKMA
jgi:hypothetical protein